MPVSSSNKAAGARMDTSPTRALAAFASNLTLAAIPPAVVAKAKELLLDYISHAVAVVTLLEQFFPAVAAEIDAVSRDADTARTVAATRASCAFLVVAQPRLALCIEFTSRVFGEQAVHRAGFVAARGTRIANLTGIEQAVAAELETRS